MTYQSIILTEFDCTNDNSPVDSVPNENSAITQQTTSSANLVTSHPVDIFDSPMMSPVGLGSKRITSPDGSKVLKSESLLIFGLRFCSGLGFRIWDLERPSY